MKTNREIIDAIERQLARYHADVQTKAYSQTQGYVQYRTYAFDTNEFKEIAGDNRWTVSVEESMLMVRIWCDIVQ